MEHDAHKVDEIKCPCEVKNYLKRIAERLVNERAAVMVGAGFSKNAEKTSKYADDFPSWEDLGKSFHDKLNSCIPLNDRKHFDVPKLAEEVEAVYNRSVLNGELKRLIPDDDHFPSQLHKDLVDLPWVDIFTTNYDTLLEEAANDVRNNIYGKKYSYVYNKKDLTGVDKPRIIKLHGSFPSYYPFIVTQEDYRTYPKKHAPFVNTVQQSLLENTFCLIGFSGDDPNFLEWIGWIRDNLGEYISGEVYLVGISKYTLAQKKLLEKRGITLIDMYSCKGLGEKNYSESIKFFLEYLKGEFKKIQWEKDPSNWSEDGTSEESDERKVFKRPTSDKFNKSRDLNSLPASSTEQDGIVDNAEVGEISKNANNKGKDGRIDEVEKITSQWKEQREKYPGWLILPENRRNNFWLYTSEWINYIRDEDISNDVFPNNMDIKFLYELNWRLEKCLTPLFDDTAQLINLVVDKNAENQDAEIKNMRIELLQSLMRYYRENWNFKEWEKVNNIIGNNIKNLKLEQKSDYYYECCLAALLQLNMKKFKDILKDWKEDDNLPLSEAKRAILSAEVWQMDQSAEILYRSIESIRDDINSKPKARIINLASQEAYIISSLKFIKLASPPHDIREVKKEFDKRIRFLKRYECDAENEMISFSKFLKHEYQQKTIENLKWEFDIGKFRRHYSLDPNDPEVLSGLNYLRMLEVIGMPFKIKNSNINQKTIIKALQRTLEDYPLWTISILVRCKSREAIDDLMNRERISSLSQDVIQEAIDIFINFLEEWAKQNKNERYSQNDLANCVSEFLSRLSLRCSYDYKIKILNLLLKIYNMKECYYNETAEKMTERVINSFSHAEKLSLLEKFSEFPICRIGNNIHFGFIHPIHFIDDRKNLSVDIKNPVQFYKRINYFFEKAISDSAEQRKSSILILGKLYSFAIFKKDDRQKFSNLLWEKLDDYELPDDTGYYKFALLNLPKPPNVNVSQRIKKYILKEAFPIRENNNRFDPRELRVDVCHEILNTLEIITWNKKEILFLHSKALEWWNAEKETIKKRKDYDIFDSAGFSRNRIAQLLRIFIHLILPRMNSNINSNVKKEILNVVIGAQEKGLPTLELECAAVHLFPEEKTKLFSILEGELASNDGDIFTDALLATLALSRQAGLEKKERQHFINLIGQATRWRYHADLYNLLNVCERIISEFPDFMSKEFKESLLIGLKNIAYITLVRDGSREYEENLSIRIKGSELAYVLFKLYQERGITIPEEIRIWKDICKSEEEYAEVKNSWIS